jgi:hypothetical protein
MGWKRSTDKSCSAQVTDKGLEILCEGITAHSLYAAGDLGGAIGAAFGELGRAMAKQHEANGLQGLTSLSLSGCTEVTDAGISKLTNLRNLTSLDILGCWMVTGQGIAALSTLSSLESLSIEVGAPRLHPLTLMCEQFTERTFVYTLSSSIF